MNVNICSRRDMLKRTAAGVSLAFAPHICRAATPANIKSAGFKIGAVDWELTKPADPGAVAVAARLGFDGLQVDLGDVQGLRSAKAQQRYSDLSKRHKIQIASLALGKLSDFCYAKDGKGQELVEAAIEVAQAMKQRVLLLAFFGANDIEKGENRTDALIGRLKENAPKAQKAGVILGVEGETSVERYRQIIDGVNSPAVKVYFDCVHAHQSGRDIYQEITFLGDRICEFHAKDYGNILFGKGSIDWAAVRRGMDAIGYRGWIQVEQWGEIKGDKPLGFDETHRRNLQFLRSLFHVG